MKKSKYTLPETLTALFVVAPVSFVLSGFTIAYGWNNILATIAGVPKITIFQAIGLDVIVSFIVADGGDSDVKDFTDLCSRALGTPIFALILLWIVTMFV